MLIDLLFPARGGTLPTDHAYLLYAALSRAVPGFHDPAAGLRFAPVTGDPAGGGRVRLVPGTPRRVGSVLRVRVAADRVAAVLPLAGRTLEVGPDAIALGPPVVVPVVPAPTVRARVVTFKNARDPDRFLAVARVKMAGLGIDGAVSIPAFADGPRAGEPRRRVVRVKGKAVVGYALVVSGLTADHSVRLQEHGLGGRTRIGCGFFLPFDPEGAK